MLECPCDRADICRLHDDALDAISDNIARFARSDLRQRAGRCFVCDFGAALPLRRKNMYCALAEIILRVRHKSYDANIITPELLQIRFSFLMHEAN